MAAERDSKEILSSDEEESRNFDEYLDYIEVENEKARNTETCMAARGGGGVLPYMGYIGMCGPKGYMVFQPFWS